MTRMLTSKSVDELAQLTRARKLFAEGELARCTARLAAVDDEICQLRSLRYEADTPSAAANLEKWEIWRASELRRLNQKKASIAAEHRVAQAKFGRLMAEEEVVDQLGLKAKRSEAIQRQRRSYIS